MPSTQLHSGARRTEPQRRSWTGPAVSAACLGIVTFGWSLRHEHYLLPDRGFGYTLGIVGSAAMLSILIYSLRKRSSWLRGVGPMRYWMRAHITMGLAGPIAVLFHTNFDSGSTNSSVALGSMLLVASSGIVGRFLYREIHRGFHGRKLEAEDLWNTVHERFGDLDELRASQRVLLASLQNLGRWTRSQPAGLGLVLRLAQRTSELRDLTIDLLGPDDPRVHAVERYLRALAKAVRFGVCERWFRSWHALHIPLFVLLVATLVAHVVAVHMY